METEYHILLNMVHIVQKNVENPMQLNFYKEKLKHTMLEKYGVENSIKS